jgi:hypothetical protein
MSTLMDLGIDADAIQEADGTGGRVVVPKGKYKAVMVANKLSDNNAGTGKIFETKWQIIEGKYTDTILMDWWNVRHPNKICQDIGLGQLKRVCRLVGVPCPPPDETQMLGKPCLLTVVVKPNYKDNTKMQNEITAYNPVPSNFSTAEKTDFPTEKPENVENIQEDDEDDENELAWENEHIANDVPW